MATNMALDSVTTTSITVHGWYGGTTPVYYGRTYCNGALFGNQYNSAGSTNWTLPSVTKLGLSPNTTYGFTCAFFAADGTTVIENSAGFYWKTDQLPQLPSPSVASHSETASAIYVTLGRVYPAPIYHARIGSGSWQSSSGRDFSFTGLSPSTTYTIESYASKSGYLDSAVSSSSITTSSLPTLPTPTISSSTVTQTSISITLNSVTSATTYYARINGGSWQSGSYPGPFNFTGLTKNTTYTIEYYCSAIGYINSNTNSSSITTPDNVKPDPWSWSASNGSASAAQTQAAYNAVTKVSGYNLSDFSYLVWNDLVDKVDAFAVYKSSSAVASGAKMTTSDKALSATRFNLLLTAVNAMASTGITSRSAGQLVYGSYFTTITSTLNGIT